MIFDILTVLFLFLGSVLLLLLIRDRRRDVLHGPYVSEPRNLLMKKQNDRPRPAHHWKDYVVRGEPLGRTYLTGFGIGMQVLLSLPQYCPAGQGSLPKFNKPPPKIARSATRANSTRSRRRL